MIRAVRSTPGRMAHRLKVLRSDAGIGLTEAAVAIIVLGIILVGLFPLAVDSVRLAVRNAEIAQANRVVSAQLDEARTSLRPADCGSPPTTTTVEIYEVTRTVGPCPEPQRLADVTVEVVKAGDPQVSSDASTRVIVRPVVVES